MNEGGGKMKEGRKELGRRNSEGKREEGRNERRDEE